ncbi:hypothetical protein BIW11_07029 [Tropilaelaps mercedesae]|uniref:Uncharacterized protein n=1 Tax=Tropilaelaps mercedesae TaxID=418985 RepID=A0A1V9XVL8_9ACAR|nr:hypothetical protein BIW11_07029 [Tropilaelaps mercedesae]
MHAVKYTVIKELLLGLTKEPQKVRVKLIIPFKCLQVATTSVALCALVAAQFPLRSAFQSSSGFGENFEPFTNFDQYAGNTLALTSNFGFGTSQQSNPGGNYDYIRSFNFERQSINGIPQDFSPAEQSLQSGGYNSFKPTSRQQYQPAQYQPTFRVPTPTSVPARYQAPVQPYQDPFPVQQFRHPTAPPQYRPQRYQPRAIANSQPYKAPPSFQPYQGLAPKIPQNQLPQQQYQPLSQRYQAPPRRYQVPSQQYETPPQRYQASPQRYQTSPQQYHAPPQQYQASPQQDQAPPQQYQAPPQQHQAPPQQYQAPPQQYQAPPQQYQTPPQQYQQEPQRPRNAFVDTARLSYDAAAPAYTPTNQGGQRSSTSAQPSKKPVITHPAAPVHYVSIGARLEGDYNFGYDTGKASNGDESFRRETRDPDGTVRGSYGYVDSNGKQITVHYEAGKEGFKILSEDEAKTRREAAARGQTDAGNDAPGRSSSMQVISRPRAQDIAVHQSAPEVALDEQPRNVGPVRRLRKRCEVHTA